MIQSSVGPYGMGGKVDMVSNQTADIDSIKNPQPSALNDVITLTGTTVPVAMDIMLATGCSASSDMFMDARERKPIWNRSDRGETSISFAKDLSELCFCCSITSCSIYVSMTRSKSGAGKDILRRRSQGRSLGAQNLYRMKS